MFIRKSFMTCALLLVMALPAVAQDPTPTDRAPSYHQLARQGRDLSMEDVAALEVLLEETPSDLHARAKLIGYYGRKSYHDVGAEKTILPRRKHILWAIENASDSELCQLSELSLKPAGNELADPEGYEQAKALWLEQQANHKDNGNVFANSAMFFVFYDKDLASEALVRAQSLDPDNPNWQRLQGMVYAMGILGITGTNPNGIPTAHDPEQMTSETAKRFRQELEETTNPRVLSAAAMILFKSGSMVEIMVRTEGTSEALDLPEKLELSEKLLKRAQSLDPEMAVQYEQMLGMLYQYKAMMAKGEEEKQKATDQAIDAKKQAAESSRSEKEAMVLLLDLMQEEFKAGRLDEARINAHKVLELALSFEGEWFYGNAIHHGHRVLGHAALKNGQLGDAKEHLLASGRIDGSPSLSSFGPNMTLAKAMLEHGEKETVIDYLKLCKNFWDDIAKLDSWIRKINAGNTPNFGANLVY